MSKALNLILIVAFMVITYSYMQRAKQVSKLHAALYMQIREAEETKCQIHQNGIVHEFQCIVKNGKFVALI